MDESCFYSEKRAFIYFTSFIAAYFISCFLRDRVVVCVRVCVTFAANRASLSPETGRVMGEGVGRDA